MLVRGPAVVIGPIAAISIAIAIALGAGGITESHGFAPAAIRTKFLSSHQEDNPSRFEFEFKFESTAPSPSASPSALPALVYGTDGSVVGDDVFENPDNGSTNVAQSNKDDDLLLLESLKSSVGDLSVWNKIACAFAPPPHDRITPEMVRDATPVGLSDTGIDIALAVPAGGSAATAAANQLVRVLVTVGFPQAWAFERDDTNEEKLSALMGLIKVLEGLADDRLSEQRSSSRLSPDKPDYYEKMVIEQRWKERLEEEPPTSVGALPVWWTAIAPPFSTPEMKDEAELLKKLLNEDEFEDELRALFVGQIEHDNGSNPLVLRAAVSSIGSSGLFLKARVPATAAESTAASDDDDDNDKETEIIVTASIPYSNPPREVISTGELREGVLLLVESVVPMRMPAIPPTTVDSIESDGEIITPFNEQVMDLVTELENETEKSSEPNAKDAEKETTQIAEAELGEDATTPEPKDDSSPRKNTTDAPSVAAAATEPKLEAETIEPIAAATVVFEESLKSETAQGPPSSRRQPRPPEEETKLAAKYAAIEDVGERAFAILRDLGMV